MTITEPTPYVFLYRPEPWKDHAACKGMTDVFFPKHVGPSTTAYAKAICATCPVQAECLESAIEHRECFGIWGGQSEKQRRPIRRQYRKGDPS